MRTTVSNGEKKSSYRLAREERETIIGRTEVDGGWSVYTSSPSLFKRLDKWTTPTKIHHMGKSIVAKEYEIPLGCISIHKPRSKCAKQKPLDFSVEGETKG